MKALFGRTRSLLSTLLQSCPSAGRTEIMRASVCWCFHTQSGRVFRADSSVWHNGRRHINLSCAHRRVDRAVHGDEASIGFDQLYLDAATSSSLKKARDWSCWIVCLWTRFGHSEAFIGPVKLPWISALCVPITSSDVLNVRPGNICDEGRQEQVVM